MLTYKDYIYAVYQERSFSKAARKLYVSQPWHSATTPISLMAAGEYTKKYRPE